MYNYITYRCYTATRHCPCTYEAVIFWAVSLSPATETARRATTLTVYSTTVPQEKRAAVIEQQCRVVFTHAGQPGGQELHLWWDDAHLVWLWEDLVLVHVSEHSAHDIRVWCSEWSFISHDTDHLLIWALQSYYTISKYILYCRMRK